MKLTLYMRSGNKIELKGVKDFEGKVSRSRNELDSLTVKYHTLPFLKPKCKVLMSSIQMEQVEAITVTKFFELF